MSAGLRSLFAVLLLLSPTIAFAATLEAMAGQMIVVGFQGDGAADKSVAALCADLGASRLGGVMYLKVNVASLKAVKSMNAAFRACSPNLPPFLTLDQEGGAVERLTEAVGFEEIANAQSVAANNSVEGAEAIYTELAQKIADLGFTVNFGPVADLNLNPDNQVIAKYGRAFGKDAATVIDYAGAFIRAHGAAHVLTALKHFPGHGSSTADSHEGFVDITDTWQQQELDPYRTLIEAGYADFVMVGHLLHRAYTQTTELLPSSLSYEWITGVLRGQLGFAGVIISDDLEMGAIRDHFGLKETVTRAVRAGMDVLLFSNTAKYRASLGNEILAILVAEAASDPAFAARIEESYARIIALKSRIAD